MATQYSAISRQPLDRLQLEYVFVLCDTYVRTIFALCDAVTLTF